VTRKTLNSILLGSATAFLVLAFALAALAEEEALDIAYAQHQPLAAKSLLLDIIAIPDHGYVAVGERGHVVHSNDGLQWTQAEVVPTRSTLTRAAQAGGRLWAAGHDSVILTSGDLGKTWTLQHYDPDRQQPIMDLHFFDEQRGLAIGAYDLFLFTDDGGKTWDEGLINEEEWHNNALLDLGDGRLMIAGEAGFSYRSTDGGATWETLEMPYGGSMFGIVPGGDGCVVVFGLRGNVQESCDFGDHWSELDSGTESSIAGATHWEGSSWYVGNSGLVLERQARGPLRVHYHSSAVDFAAIVPVGGGRFLLVGEDGVHQYPEQEGSDGD
jgi:photosystem II stability/assembly factor-like uncharacterized protein